MSMSAGHRQRLRLTVTSQFLSEITIAEPSPGTATGTPAGTGTAISTLEELKALFTLWVKLI